MHQMAKVHDMFRPRWRLRKQIGSRVGVIGGYETITCVMLRAGKENPYEPCHEVVTHGPAVAVFAAECLIAAGPQRFRLSTQTNFMEA
jgi:hypothetical protein